MSEYSEKLKDPRWQKKRLEVMERDLWCCQACYDMESTLIVHHRRYLTNTEPWDYPDELLVTLCEECHLREREIRPASESDLLAMVKSNFLRPALDSLVLGFHQATLQHTDQIVADVIAWVLTDSDLQRELIKRFFAKLRVEARAKVCLIDS